MTRGAPEGPLTAPPLRVSGWFNTSAPLTLDGLRGRVVAIEAFQMLCPGCVLHGLPQASTIANTFPEEDVVVLGLHSVFEHHSAMEPHALEAFLHEYRIGFPVAVDEPADPGAGPIPKTMQAYALRGTPSLLLIDRAGQLRHRHFGKVSDMLVGAQISELLLEKAERRGVADDASGATDGASGTTEGAACTPEGCT